MPFNFRFPSRPGLRKTSSPSSSHRINNIEIALVVGYPAKSFTNPASNIITLAPFQDRTEFSVATGRDQDGPEQPLEVLDLLMR